jgi:hypothetical protein
LSYLKAAATLLGVIGSAGGVFAALSFGIGYLAIKKQDELIGLPTTLSDPTTYIRTGALFFSNSTYFLLSATYRLFVLIVVITLLLALFIGATKKIRHFPLRRIFSKGTILMSSLPQGWLLPASYVLLLVLALCTLSLQTAAFDPQNRNLLYQVISDREAKLAQRTDTQSMSVKEADQENLLVLPPWRESLADRINARLRHPQGRGSLQLMYGQQLALVLVVLYGLVVCRLKRKQQLHRIEQLGSTSSEWMSFRIAQSLSPLVLLVALALVVNLPTVYGILCLPTRAAMVRVSVVGSKGTGETRSGTLISDLSSGSREIWLLSENQGKFNLGVLDRAQLRSITLMGEGTDNFLAVENPE